MYFLPYNKRSTQRSTEGQTEDSEADSATDSKTEGRTQNAKDNIFSTLYMHTKHTQKSAKKKHRRKTEKRRGTYGINATLEKKPPKDSAHTHRRKEGQRRGMAARLACCVNLYMEAATASEANTQRTARTKGRKEKEMKKEAMQNTAHKEITARKVDAIVRRNTQTEGRKEKDMKKNTQKKEAAAVFDINAHNNNMILEHADGSREAITAEDMKEKALKRYEKEKVSTLRKWAKARGIASADTLKKAALIVVLAEDDIKPKEEKEAAKKTRKEAAEKKNADAKQTAAAKKNAPKKEKKTAAQKPKKDSAKKKEDASKKMDSIKTSLQKEDARIVCAMDVQNMQNADIADALNRIKELRLYEAKGADSMKDFVENKCATDADRAEGKKGKYHGMTYSHVNKYINAHNYVYSMKDADGAAYFLTYGMHLVQALIAPCRHHAEEVREAVKEGKITASMSLKALNELIESEGWKKEKKEGAQKTDAEAAEDATEEAAEEMPKAEKHNGVTEEAAEDAAAVLSAFIEEAKISEAKKKIATKALEVLMKRADI